MQLSEQEVVRREKLAKLRALGMNPYPADLFPLNSNSKEIKEDFAEDKQVIIAGRLMSRRIQGKASFAELQDGEGRIQVYFNRDEICTGEDKTLYNDVYKKLLDIGDFVGIEGDVFKTKVGEISVKVKSMTILCKSIRPLPIVKEKEDELYDAFTSKEMRYRNRHLDLIVNPQVRETFYKRTKIISSIRSFLDNLGFLEVETPILQPIYGGANARPFTTYHNAAPPPRNIARMRRSQRFLTLLR